MEQAGCGSVVVIVVVWLCTGCQGWGTCVIEGDLSATQWGAVHVCYDDKYVLQGVTESPEGKTFCFMLGAVERCVGVELLETRPWGDCDTNTSFRALCHLAEKAATKLSDDACAREAEKKHLACRDRYCCAADARGTIWVGCPDTVVSNYCGTKIGKDRWLCNGRGVFEPEELLTEGCAEECSTGCFSLTCSGSPLHFPCSNLSFSHPLTGYFSVPCNSDGKFGKPDTSKCCDGAFCTGTDPFLHVWSACEGETVTKESQCLGDASKRAAVTWECRKEGFVGVMPDYTHCGTCLVQCDALDRYGQRWRVCTDSMGTMACPAGMAGTAYWTCEKSGQFSTPQPDYSTCVQQWIPDVKDMITANDDSLLIMDAIANHTTADPDIGMSEALGVVGSTIDLFIAQNKNNGTVEHFDNMTRSYTGVLKNLVGDTGSWTSVMAQRRLEYGRAIISHSETLGFALFKVLNTSQVVYTRETADPAGTFYGTFYGPQIVGETFPRDRGPLDCSISVLDVLHNDSPSYAAVMLVLRQDVGSLLFSSSGGAVGRAVINGPVLSFTVAEPTRTVPNVTVSLAFQHHTPARDPDTLVIQRTLHPEEAPSAVPGSAHCAFLESDEWSQAGCRVVSTSANVTVCTCQHLSTFAVLMDMHEYIPDHTLEVFSLTCSSLSVVCLLLTLGVFFGVRSIQSERTTIGKHLCFCLLVGHVMVLTLMDKKFFYLSDVACGVVAILLHYIFLAAFCWMSVEGHHLYRFIVSVFYTKVDYKNRYLMFGYGVPLLVVSLTGGTAAILRERAYGRDELCWLTTPKYIWGFIGPVIFFTSLNLLILLATVRVAVAARSKDSPSPIDNVRMWLKGWFSLCVLLGITWLLALAYVDYNQPLVYGFVFLNGLQGLFIFVFRCVCNSQIRSKLLQEIRSVTSYTQD